MGEFVSGPGAATVVIYTEGIGDYQPSPGAWGAVLRWGSHSREISGFEADTTETDVRLQAVIRALECLKRPVRVEVRTKDSYVSFIAADWLEGIGASGEDDEAPGGRLRPLLLAAAAQHDVVFGWEDAYAREPDHERATELALQAAKGAGCTLFEEDEDEDDEKGVPCDGPSIRDVLAEFLLDKKAKSPSRRTFKKYEKVIGSLEWGIGWYADKSLDAIPASEINSHLGSFYETLIHKEFATASQLRDARSVLTALLKWLQEKGHLSAETVAAEIEDVKERLDDYVDVRKFVDALSDYVEDTAPDVSDGNFYIVGNQYLMITEVTEDSITFCGPGEEPVGPFAIPSEIADMAQWGWEILLSAARIGDEWQLLEVVNGERG